MCIYPFLEEWYELDREAFVCPTVKVGPGKFPWQVPLPRQPVLWGFTSTGFIQVSPEIPWICPLAPRTWCLQRLLWNSTYPRVRWTSRCLPLTLWKLEKSLILFNKEQMLLKTLPLLLVTFFAVFMDLCSGIQCSEPRCGEYVCLYLFGPIYISKPLKCSLAGRSGQAGKLSFRCFFVCLQVILATDRDTQLVVCALLHDQAEAGLWANEGWSGAKQFHLILGLIWRWIGQAAALLPSSVVWHLRAWFGFACVGSSIQHPSVMAVEPLLAQMS